MISGVMCIGLLVQILHPVIIQWPDERPKQPQNFSDVHDGTHWQSYILGDEQFCPDGKLHRNFALMFCGDGVNHFKRKGYSMWPLAMACANLPAHMRMTLPATWLPCIVPAQGPKKSEPDDFQVFLEIVVDELNYLYHVGLQVKDSTHR